MTDHELFLTKQIVELEAEFKKYKQDAVTTEVWLIEQIDSELKRIGLPILSWADGGGGTCPTGWHRNPYISVGKAGPPYQPKEIEEHAAHGRRFFGGADCMCSVCTHFRKECE